MSEMQLWVQRSTLLCSAPGTHFLSLCCLQPLTPALRPKRDISWAQGNSIQADSPQHKKDRESAVTFAKAKAGRGSQRGFSGRGLGGSKAMVSSFLRMEKTPENKGHWFPLLAQNSTALPFAAPAILVVFEVKKGNILFFIPLDLNFSRDGNCTVVGYDFIPSFLHFYYERRYIIYKWTK